jgi:hypothetical protein
LSERRVSIAAAGDGFAGEIGGEGMVGDAASRNAAGALEGSGA